MTPCLEELLALDYKMGSVSTLVSLSAARHSYAGKHFRHPCSRPH